MNEKTPENGYITKPSLVYLLVFLITHANFGQIAQLNGGCRTVVRKIDR